MPIKRLSVQLANQIAAGEVVERPASVVKELVENAVDAKSSSIVVEIKNAGKQLIRVTDNGHGIVKDELALALAPHATSKISSLDDLQAITTLGFRGEALASIASVSELTLTSNTKDQEHGYQVKVSGAEQHPDIVPAAHKVGTTIEVKELFFNTPARRRFLKSDKTEFTHIKELLLRLALVNYNLEFTFISDGKVVFHVPVQSKSALADRINKLLGSEFKGSHWSLDNSDPNFIKAYQDYLHHQEQEQGLAYQPFYLNHDCDQQDNDVLGSNILRIHGLLLKPQSFSKSSPDRLLTFLNGRCIVDKTINHALREAYLNAVQQDLDFKPSIRGVLFMECDPYIVDVNVHPRKDEVRFHNPNLIHDCIVANINAVMELQHVSKNTIAKGTLDLDYTKIIDGQDAATNDKTATPNKPHIQALSPSGFNHYAFSENSYSSNDEPRPLNSLDLLSDDNLDSVLSATYEHNENFTADESPNGGYRHNFTQQVERYLQATKSDLLDNKISGHLSGKICNINDLPSKEQEQELCLQARQSLQDHMVTSKDVDQGSAQLSSALSEQDSANMSLDQILLKQEQERYQAHMAEKLNERVIDVTNPLPASKLNSQFLSLVTADVMLFCCEQRYFIAKGSELHYEILKQSYIRQVQESKVETYELSLPFALKCDTNLIKACRQKDVLNAAHACGFVIKSQLGRNCIEIYAIPKIIVKSNLANIAMEALSLICLAVSAITDEKKCPVQLANLLSHAKSISINTDYDAQQLLLAMDNLAMIENLIKANHAQELNLLSIASDLIRP